MRNSMVIGLLVWAATAQAVISVPPGNETVTDLTGTFAPHIVRQLTDKLDTLEEDTGVRILVLAVPTTEDESIEDFGVRVNRARMPGHDKVGEREVVFLFIRNDRKLKLEVGDALPAISPALQTSILVDTVFPRFHEGDWAQGIEDGVDVIIEVVRANAEMASAHR